MGLFSLRPSPEKFFLKALPLYLTETERPIQSQALLCGSESYLQDVTDEPLKTILAARAITCGTFFSALMMARVCSSKQVSISTEEILTKADVLSFGSIDPQKNQRMKNDPALKIWAGIACKEIQMDVAELTKVHLLEQPDSPNIDEWVKGVGQLYFNALHHCLTEKDYKRIEKSLSKEELDERNGNLNAYCISFAGQHQKILHDVMTELIDLMES